MNRTPSYPLKLGVVIPTRNSMALLPAHLDSLQKWIGIAEEVVVVDSLSTDGTFEFLRKELHHPAVTFHQRPPGLYQSWNYGIAQLSTEWAYISTIGEQITGEGIGRLIDAATSHKADVVISPPRFVTERGTPVRRKKWPVHHLVASRKWHGIDSVPLHPLSIFMLSAIEAPMGMLGSSAANIYRTACLCKHSFSSAYDHFGDTAWAIVHAFQSHFALVPHELSTFTLHASGASMGSVQLEAVRARLFEAAKETVRQKAVRMNSSQLKELADKFDRFVLEFHSMRNLEQEFDRQRRARRPWVLNAEAWKARRQRDRLRDAVRKLKNSLMEDCARITREDQEVPR